MTGREMAWCKRASLADCRMLWLVLTFKSVVLSGFSPVNLKVKRIPAVNVSPSGGPSANRQARLGPLGTPCAAELKQAFPPHLPIGDHCSKAGRQRVVLS